MVADESGAAGREKVNVRGNGREMKKDMRCLISLFQRNMCFDAVAMSAHTKRRSALEEYWISSYVSCNCRGLLG